MKFGKILVSIYQPGSAAILNSIPGLEVIEGLARCQRSIKFQGAKIWNSISPHIRNQSFNTFKRNIKIQLLNSYI